MHACSGNGRLVIPLRSSRHLGDYVEVLNVVSTNVVSVLRLRRCGGRLLLQRMTSYLLDPDEETSMGKTRLLGIVDASSENVSLSKSLKEVDQVVLTQTFNQVLNSGTE